MHLPGHPVTTVLLGDTIKGTPPVFRFCLHWTKFRLFHEEDARSGKPQHHKGSALHLQPSTSSKWQARAAVIFQLFVHRLTHTFHISQAPILKYGVQLSKHPAHPLSHPPPYWQFFRSLPLKPPTLVQKTGNYNLAHCFSTAGPRSGTGPWHQLYRAARGSPGIDN